MLKRYELGIKGYESALALLREGRSLSQQLESFVLQQTRTTFTLLPDGSDAQVTQFDKHLHYKTVSNLRQPSTRLFGQYSAIDVIVHVISNIAIAHPQAIVWTEDYLARPGDQAVWDPLLTKLGVRVITVGDAVTHMTNVKAFSSSGYGNQIVGKLRNIPIWNGAILDSISLDKMGAHIDQGNVAAILAHCLLVFCTAYDGDGFLFVDTASGISF